MEKSIECEDVIKSVHDIDEDSIPLADDDASAVLVEDTENSENSDNARTRAMNKWRKGHESLDSIPSMISLTAHLSGSFQPHWYHSQSRD